MIDFSNRVIANFLEIYSPYVSRHDIIVPESFSEWKSMPNVFHVIVTMKTRMSVEFHFYHVMTSSWIIRNENNLVLVVQKVVSIRCIKLNSCKFCVFWVSLVRGIKNQNGPWMIDCNTFHSKNIPH